MWIKWVTKCPQYGRLNPSKLKLRYNSIIPQIWVCGEVDFIIITVMRKGGDITVGYRTFYVKWKNVMDQN